MTEASRFRTQTFLRRSSISIIPQKEKSKGIDLKKIPRDELPAIVKDLTSQMQLAAANLDFERAADLRDQIEAIKTTLAAK